MKLTAFLVLFAHLFQGCSDNYISQVHSKGILQESISCMNLVVFPLDKDIQNSFEKLYPFSKDCTLDLHVSYKNSIVCNSTQNVEKRALGMPKSYLRLEVKREQKLFYSYYKDLADNLEEKDIQKAFNTMQDALALNL